MTPAEELERELVEIRKRIDLLWFSVLVVLKQQGVKVERVH